MTKMLKLLSSFKSNLSWYVVNDVIAKIPSGSLRKKLLEKCGVKIGIGSIYIVASIFVIPKALKWGRNALSGLRFYLMQERDLY